MSEQLPHSIDEVSKALDDLVRLSFSRDSAVVRARARWHHKLRPWLLGGDDCDIREDLEEALLSFYQSYLSPILDQEELRLSEIRFDFLQAFLRVSTALMTIDAMLDTPSADALHCYSAALSSATDGVCSDQASQDWRAQL